MPDFQQGNDAKGGTLVVTVPPHFPTMHTRETATHLAAFGLDENQVAVILRCTPDDVRKHYAVEMEHGLMLVNSRVKSAVLHQALHKEDVNAMKLWLINNAGWRAGDGNKTNILNTTPGAGEEGTMTIVQKREVITRLLVQATQHKRREETVIDAEVVPTPKKNGNGTNGHGSNGSNGNGSNGHGGANGAKHR